MKKLLLPFIIIGYFASAQSPITFNIGDVPVAGPGSIQRIAIDTLPLPSINFGSKGANQVYDFSNLVLWKYDTVEYRTPTSGQLSTCPNADDAITTDGSAFLFTNTDNANNKLTLEGFQGELTPGNSISAAYSTKPDIYHFPTIFQSNFHGTAYLQKTVTGSSVGQPFVDNVELTINTTYSDTTDGWGKVITPVGAYKCLRKKRIETTNTVIRAYYFGSWHPVSNDTKTTTRYTYITKEAKGSVVNFTYDTAGVLQSVNWSMTPPATPVADFTWNNVSGGLVTFTDQSDNYPTSWSWTFGDASTSTLQNPNHTYATNNTYNVCLTATNAGGSHQVCKSVTVTGITAANNPPVAFDDTLSVTGGSSTILHVAGNDIDPDNDNICVTAVWGSPYATEAIGGSCDMIRYEPDSAFSGMDTCYYQLCDNGSPVLCDTGMVVFTVDALNHPPVAVDDTASVMQPNGTMVNVGINDTDPDGNSTFCALSVYGSAAFSIAAVGNCTNIAYQPDSTFTGMDTCWYVICDNGTPVYCDTAMLVVTSVANPALLPVAGFDVYTLHCQGVIGINSSTNADSIMWTYHHFAGSGSVSDTTFYNVDTTRYGGVSDNSQFQICLTAYNRFGTTTYCDTATTMCESIHEISLSNIHLYPNPVNQMLSIDMKSNEEDITRSYTSIEVYNQLGQQVKTVVRKNDVKVVNISVADLPEGMYVTAITGLKGERRTLGRFTIRH